MYDNMNTQHGTPNIFRLLGLVKVSCAPQKIANLTNLICLFFKMNTVLLFLPRIAFVILLTIERQQYYYVQFKTNEKYEMYS